MISKSKEGNKRERRTESQPYQNETTSSPVKPNAENKKMSKYTSSNSKSNLMRSINASSDAAQGKRNYESGFAVLQNTGDGSS